MSDLSKISHTLPQKPGVYLYHDEQDTVIYVGKAIKLRSRVSSYFRKSANLPLAKQLMVEQIARIEHIIVRSETEALLLESTLIKKFRPKYNVLLKDDKFFQYIKIHLKDHFPQVETVRKVTIDGSRYFGPYTSGLAVRQTMRLLKRLFPYKSCNNDVDVPCFDYQLGRCLGHDTGPGSEQRYQAVIKKLITFLEGNTGTILTDLKKEMKIAAARRDFEQAAILRDRWQALQHVIEQQTVITPRRDSFDVLSLARREDIAAVNLFQVRQGKLVQRDQFMLQHVREQSEADILIAFIEQYYSQSTVHPRLVVTPVAIPVGNGNALQLDIRLAQRGLKRKLVGMGRENAEDYLRREQERWLSEDSKAKLALEELAQALHLDGPPHRIEMYDISHFQSTNVVASMVVFENGLPKKSDYRKFAIRDTNIPDDQHRLAEVVRRRFTNHGSTENDGEDSPPLRGGVGGGQWPMPNLLLLDGGKGQLSVVIKSVPGLTQHIPVAALAKEHEELFVPGRSSPIRLPEGSQELFLIQRIRDEAHRFAIGFYRKKHRTATTRSVLDEVPGLGPIAKKRLLDRFGDVQGIRQAAEQDLEHVLGAKLTRELRQYI